MPLRTHQDEPPALNLTSLIDVLFLLIIFFMVGTKFSQDERALDVSVPQVNDRGQLAEPQPTRQISVDRTGQIALDGQMVTLADLTSRLATARRAQPGLSVVVRGDGAVPYQQMAEVLNACRQAGVRDVGMAVRTAPNRK